MYIPGSFKITDKGKVLDFVKRFNFGTIVSVSESRPVGTHLPFVVAAHGDSLLLCSHFAKANSQWKDLDGKEVLVIFTEPHAYISPKNYDKIESVPTWNYVAVHAYGKVEIISESGQVVEILEQMITSFEPGYQEQWRGLSEDYKMRMINGIVAFRILVEEIQASEKLSQNKNQGERLRIITTLLQSEHEHDRLIGRYMKDQLE